MTIETSETNSVREALAHYLRQRCDSFDELVEFAAERLADLTNDVETYEQLLECERQRAVTAETTAEAERAERRRLAEMVMPYIREYQKIREHLSVTVPTIIDDMVNGVELLVKSQVDEVLKVERSAVSSKGGRTKYENNPKRAGKMFVKECWREWQSKPSIYKSKAAFARDMLEKREELASTQVIEDWCRQWEREGCGT